MTNKSSSQTPTVLLCLDLEAGSQELAHQATQHARQCGQSILLLHVIRTMIGNEEVARCRQCLTEIANEALAGVRIEDTLIEQGTPEEIIISIAQEYGVNSIVLGRRFRTTVDRIYVGSTTSAVISVATRPVLVVPVDAAVRREK